jgi:hypothetical protein
MSQAGNVTDARGPALSAGSQLASTGTVVFSNSNGITFGMSNSSVITASYTVPTAPTTISEFQPFYMLAASAGAAPAQGSLSFVPFDLPNHLSAYRLNLFHSFNTVFSAVNNTGSASFGLTAGLYTRGTGTNTDRLSLQWSQAYSASMSNSSNTALSITHFLGISNSTAVSTSQYLTNDANASTYLVNSIFGQRAVPLPISSVLTPGRYWLAIVGSSTQANNSYAFFPALAQQGLSNAFNAGFQPMGTSSKVNSNFNPLAGFGVYATTTGALPGSAGLTNSDITFAKNSLFNIPIFNFSAYTTGNNVL